MSSYHFFKLTPWTKVSLDNSLLGQLCHWTKVPWTTVSLDKCPLDNCCNTDNVILEWEKTGQESRISVLPYNFSCMLSDIYAECVWTSFPQLSLTLTLLVWTYSD